MSLKLIFDYIISGIIPILIGSVVVYGIFKGVKVYEAFVEGAKEGLKICLRIFPYLLAMLLAVAIIRESMILEYFIKLLSPVLNLIGVPSEILPLVMIKPLSGSGALGVFTDTITQYGVDTYIGLVASIIMAGTETLFYTLSIYYGTVKIKKIRHTMWAAILADMVAILMAVNMAKIILN